MVIRPYDQLANRFEKRPAHRRERVVDPRRHHRIDRPRHDPIPLQASKRHGEHPLADSVDAAQQFGETALAFAQMANHED